MWLRPCISCEAASLHQLRNCVLASAAQPCPCISCAAVSLHQCCVCASLSHCVLCPCTILAPTCLLRLQVKGYDTLHAELVAMNVRKTEHVVLLQLSKEQELLYKGYLEVCCTRAPPRRCTFCHLSEQPGHCVHGDVCALLRSRSSSCPCFSSTFLPSLAASYSQRHYRLVKAPLPLPSSPHGAPCVHVPEQSSASKHQRYMTLLKTRGTCSRPEPSFQHCCACISRISI